MGRPRPRLRPRSSRRGTALRRAAAFCLPVLAGGAEGEEPDSQCQASDFRASAPLDVEVEKECGALDFLGIRPNHTVKPFWFDRCLGLGVFHEIWLVRRLDACDAPPAVLKVPASKVAHTLWPRPIRRMLRNFMLKTECGTTKVLRQRDPDHFVDCLARDKLLVENGKHLPYTLMSVAPGRSLWKWRQATPKEPPPILRNLSAVFDLTLRMFELMDRGIRPELWQQANASSRYYLHDLNIRNVMITEDGKNLTVIDNDRTAFCCVTADSCDYSLGISKSWDRRVCHPLTDRWYKESMVAKILDTLLSLLTTPPRSPADIDAWHFVEEVAPDSIVPLPPLGAILRWCCGAVWRHIWRPLWSHTGEAMDRHIAEYIDFILGRLRPAYYRDWQRVDGASLVTEAATAVYQYDVTWPPAFVVRLRELRRELG